MKIQKNVTMNAAKTNRNDSIRENFRQKQINENMNGDNHCTNSIQWKIGSHAMKTVVHVRLHPYDSIRLNWFHSIGFAELLITTDIKNRRKI